MNEAELLSMGLHDEKSAGSTTTVTRVYGGWIYEISHYHSGNYGARIFDGASTCFVPEQQEQSQ